MHIDYKKYLSQSVILKAFFLSFFIVLCKGVYKHIGYKYSLLDYFESELLNYILYLPGIPLINFLLLYLLYFSFFLLINKFLNKRRDKNLWNNFIFQLMAPAILALFLHPIFFVLKKISALGSFVIIIDQIIVLSIIVYTLYLIKTIYQISVLKTFSIFLFGLFPLVVFFSGKVLCPYFLWL